MTDGADGVRWKARREADILTLSLLEFPISNRRGKASFRAFARLVGTWLFGGVDDKNLDWGAGGLEL